MTAEGGRLTPRSAEPVASMITSQVPQVRYCSNLAPVVAIDAYVALGHSDMNRREMLATLSEVRCR